MVASRESNEEIIRQSRGPKYCVNTEGVEHDWDQATITTEQIAELGGWDPALGVIQVNHDNTERTLKPGEVVELQPGRGFCRRVRWKRGLNRPERIDAEIGLLRDRYPGLEVKDRWVRVPDYPLSAGWNRPDTDVAFEIADGYPGTPPYGLYVTSGLRFNGTRPSNFSEPGGVQPPFDGTWGVFSWTVTDANQWRPSARVEHGSNLLQWVRSFEERFAEGV